MASVFKQLKFNIKHFQEEAEEKAVERKRLGSEGELLKVQ